MENYCRECERSIEELEDARLELDNDGYCSECGPKLMQEWEEEQAALYRQWARDRL